MGDCDYGCEGEHAEPCGQRPMTITKQQFADAAEGMARAVLDDYLLCMRSLGLNQEQAIEQAVDENVESARCYAGIGSCYMGGCKHE